MAGQKIEIVPFEPSLERDWQIITKKYVSLYHDIRWKNIIEDTYHLKPLYLLVYLDGKPVGIFPSFGINAKEALSIPYLPFAGILCEDEFFKNEIMNSVFEIFKRNGIRKIITRTKSDAHSSEKGYVTMVKALETKVDEAFAALHHKQKNLVRRAEEQKFIFRKATVEEFYPVYLKATHALGTPAHPLSFFKSIHKHFREEIRIHIVLLEEKAVGTILEIDYENTRFDLWAFSLKKYFPYKPNMFMYWETLKDAIEKKMKYYDFGRSAVNSGTYHFKKQWGALPVPLDYSMHKLNSNAWKTQAVPVKQGGLASKIWSVLPGFIVDHVGPQLRKYIY